MMRVTRPGIGGVSLAMGMAALVCLAVPAAGQGPGSPAEVARTILAQTGVRGGLVVHLGCGDGRLTAALHAGDGYLVQGLDADPRHVAEARAYVQGLGLYGPVSVEQL
jgi:predicted RNA methylase